jgi:hypothetical protein
MDTNGLTKNDLMVIISKGQIFCPAYLHYGSKELNISCNYCGRKNLACCVGYENYDLCMECVDKITRPSQQNHNFLKQNNSNHLNIRPSNDFELGNVGGKWTDQFDSSLNPSGFKQQIRTYKTPSFFNQTRQDGRNGQDDYDGYNAKSNYVTFDSAQNSTCSSNFTKNKMQQQMHQQMTNPRLNPRPNSQTEPNYIETFYQPLNPNGFPKRG